MCIFSESGVNSPYIALYINITTKIKRISNETYTLFNVSLYGIHSVEIS